MKIGSSHEKKRPTTPSVRPHVTGSDQSLENSQLSCPAEVKTVVCGHIRHLSINPRLKETHVSLPVLRKQQKHYKYTLYILTCDVRMQAGSEMAPRRRQLTLRRTEGSTGVSRK